MVIDLECDDGPVVDLGVTVDPLYTFTGEQIVDLADLDILATDEENSPRPPSTPTSKASAKTPAPAVILAPAITPAPDNGKV